MMSINERIQYEINEAERLDTAGDAAAAFRHLERAHILGQSNTIQHTRVHWLMLKHGLKNGDRRQVAGQTIRIAGAATKTPLGIYPKGNTGGVDVSPFKSMPIPDDLIEILETSKK